MASAQAITYGGFTVGAGGSSTYKLVGKLGFVENYTSATVTFQVLVVALSSSSLLSAEDALRDAFTEPDQALLVQLSGSTRHTYNPADDTNTALYCRPGLRKLGGADDTERSARYEVTVSVDLPADLAGRNGRLESGIDISSDASGIRTITFTGVYTALANNLARAQFEAEFTTYAEYFLTDLGAATWHQVGEPSTQQDTQNKRLTFSRVYREQLYAITGGDAAGLIDPRVTFRSLEPGLNDTFSLGGVRPFRYVDATFRGKVLKADTDLQGIWTSTIQPFIEQELRSYVPGRVGSVILRDVSYGPNENEIVATARLQVEGSSQFFTATTTLDDKFDYGTIFKPTWNGNPFARDRYEGPASWVRTATRATTGRHDPGDPHGDPPEYPGFEIVRERHRRRPFNFGIPEQPRLALAYVSIYTYVRVDVVSGFSGGALVSLVRGSSGTPLPPDADADTGGATPNPPPGGGSGTPTGGGTPLDPKQGGSTGNNPTGGSTTGSNPTGGGVPPGGGTTGGTPVAGGKSGVPTLDPKQGGSGSGADPTGSPSAKNKRKRFGLEGKIGSGGTGPGGAGEEGSVGDPDHASA